MPLLNNSEITPDDEEENEPVDNQQEESQEVDGQEDKGSLTITAEEVAKQVKEKADPNDWKMIQQTVNAGMKLLFQNEQSHEMIFGQINTNDQVSLADELGTGATNIAMQMYQSSKGTMPLQVIIPSGAILLAKTCEFINDTGIAPVTDEDFSDAMEVFTASIQDKLDPNFRNKIGMGQEQQSPMQPDTTQQPQGSGLLQQQGV